MRRESVGIWKWRKTGTLFCAFLLLFLCMQGLQMEGIAAETENLLQNGDFSERDENGIPIGWGCSEGAWETVIRPADEGVILSRETNGANLSVSQYITHIIPGAEYEISAMVKSQNVSGSAVSVKMEFWKGTPGKPNHGDFLGDTQGAFFPNTNGEWKKYTQNFSAPAQCEYVSVMLRLYGRGTVQYKEAAVIKTKDPVILSLKTDEVFYYTDMDGNGTAKLSETAFYYLTYENKQVTFTLSDENGAVLKSETVSFTEDGGASFTYPLNLLQKKETVYTVRAEFKDSGKTLYTFTQNIYKYDRPVGIDKNGQLTDKNGDPFYPVVAYHCREADLEKAAKAGINLAQGYWGSVSPEEYLNIAERNGIQVMVSLYPNLKPAAHPDSRAYAINLLETLKDHPALFGWMIMDEPYYNLYAPEKILEESYRLIRAYDAVHPIYILECETEHFADAAKYGDILGIDPYIGDGTLENTVSDMTEKAENAVNGKKPVVSILQTFLQDGYFPTAEDVQHMLCQAAFSGAEGIGYYCFEKANGTNSLTATSLWPGLEEKVRPLISFLFPVFADGQYDGVVAEKTDGDVWYKVWNRDGRYAAVFINQSQTAETVTVSGFYDVVRNTHGNGAASSISGMISVSLPVHGVVAINADDEENAAPMDSTILSGLTPHMTYTVSIDAKSDTDGAIAVHTAFMHVEDGKAERLHAYEKRNGIGKNDALGFAAVYGGTDGYRKTDGEWKKIIYNVTLPENANAIKVTLGNHKDNALVCYQNLRIEKAQNLIPDGAFEGVEPVYTSMAGHIKKASGAVVSAEKYGLPVSAEENGGIAEGKMLELTSEQTRHAQISVPVINGETYYFSVDYNTVSTSCAPAVWMYYTDGTETRFLAENLPMQENKWKRFETLFTVEASGEKGKLTEVCIELRELNGRGTVVWDNLTLEPKGVRFYDGVRRITTPQVKSGLVMVAIDYVPKTENGGAIAFAVAYFSDTKKDELADVEAVRIPKETDMPLTVKGTLNLAPGIEGKGYTLRGFIWEW